MQNLLCQKQPSSAGTETPKAAHRLLIVEDDRNFLDTLTIEFEERGYRVFPATSTDEVKKLARESFRFAILDLRVGQDNGLSILDLIKSQSPDCRIVLLTGYGSIATAVQAVKLGACNYLTKPVSIELLEKSLWMDLTEENNSSLPDDRTSLARHEREYIEYVLNQCGGNISKAADWLGVFRQSLQRKLRKYPPKK